MAHWIRVVTFKSGELIFVLLKLHSERLVLHPHENLTHENLKIRSLAWNISDVVQLSWGKCDGWGRPLILVLKGQGDPQSLVSLSEQLGSYPPHLWWIGLPLCSMKSTPGGTPSQARASQQADSNQQNLPKIVPGSTADLVHAATYTQFRQIYLSLPPHFSLLFPTREPTG